MTQSIGVRELKNQLSQVLKEVAEQGTEINITNHGQVVARLVPPKAEIDSNASEAAWDRLKELSKQVSSKWTGGGEATEVINKVRRDL